MKKFYIIGENSRLIDEINKRFGSTLSLADELNNSVDVVFEITNYNKEIKFNNLASIEESISKNALIISSSCCIPLLEQSIYVKNPRRLAGAGLYPTFSEMKGIEITRSQFTSEDSFKKIQSVFQDSGFKTFEVTDRPGLIFLRIVTLIINEAYLVLQEGTSNREDIDTAMKLGTNYPYGPIEWSERIGIDLVYNLLKCMHNFYGDDRYRITPLLYETYLKDIASNDLR